MTKAAGKSAVPARKPRLFLVLLSGGVAMAAFTLVMVLLPFLPVPPLPEAVSNIRAGVLGSDLYVFHTTSKRGEEGSGEGAKERWVRKLVREGEVVFEDPSAPFYDEAAYRGQLWLFSEGAYRTFDGKRSQDFSVPWIGHHPSVVSDGRRIWILSRIGKDLELSAYSEGAWEKPIKVKLPGGDTADLCPDPCRFELGVLNDGLHLLWVHGGRLFHWAWKEDGTGEVRDLAPARELEVLSAPDEIAVWFLPAGDSPRPGYQRVEMLRFDGTAWSGGPGFERPNPASHLELAGIALDGGIRLLVNNVVKVELLALNGKGYHPIAVLAGAEVGSVIMKFMTGLFILLVVTMTGMSGGLSWTMNRWKHSGPLPDALTATDGHEGRGTGVAYATVWRRFLAKSVDTLLVSAPLGAVIWWKTDPASFLFMGSASDFFSTGGRAFMLIPIALLVYHSVLEAGGRNTPGKRLAGIRVVGTDGKPCGIGRAFLRNIFRLLDGIYLYGIALVSISATDRWQRIGDLVGRTIVVRAERRSSGE
ncbi:MAG TPA: RDD family protein [Nitrospiria bacterium]